MGIGVRRVLISIIVSVSLGALAIGAALTIYPPLVEVRHQGLLEQSLTNVAERWLGAAVSRFAMGPAHTIESAEKRADLPEFRTITAPDTAALSRGTPLVNGIGQGWGYSFGDQSASKYSALEQINPDTIKRLQPVWIYETPVSPRNVQATPIYTGALLVIRDSRGSVVALDPVTGQERWSFAPAGLRMISRGLVYVPEGDAGQGQVLFTASGRLYALDAITGVPRDGFGSAGSVTIGYESRTAPVVDGGTVIVSSYRPGLHAFSLSDGQHLWSLDIYTGRTFRSPLVRAFALSLGPSGARPWGGMALDSGRSLAFVTTSDPGPVGLGVTRPGDNAPANSVVAVDTTDGRIRWIFQDVAHDLWDLDISAPPLLGAIQLPGGLVDVVFTATKSGNLFILDRETGRPVFDVRQRRAPPSEIPGERTASYQHDPELPQPFGTMAFSEADITDIGHQNSASVVASLSGATYGFFAPHRPNWPTVFFGLHGGATQFGAAFNPIRRQIFVAANHVPATITLVDGAGIRATSRVDDRGAQIWQSRCAGCHGMAMQGTEAAPALQGQPLNYSLDAFAEMMRAGLRQMPAIDDLSAEETATLHAFLAKVLQTGVVETENSGEVLDPASLVRRPYSYLLDFEGYPGSRPPWGTLTAYDADSGTIQWRVPLGRYDELLARGLEQTGTPNVGGPIVTAGGLVFVSGTLDHLLRAFDVETGAELWEYRLPFIGSASPMTFAHNGAQYLVVPATGGGVLAQYFPDIETGSSFVVFRLGPDS